MLQLASCCYWRVGTAADRLAVDVLGCMVVAAGRLANAAEQRVGAAAGRLVVWVRPSAVWQASSAAIWPAGRLRAASVFTRILYLLQHYHNCISAWCMDSARTAVGRA